MFWKITTALLSLICLTLLTILIVFVSFAQPGSQLSLCKSIPPIARTYYENLLHDPVTDHEACLAKENFVQETQKALPDLWYVTSHYWRPLSGPEYREGLLTFVDDLDPYSTVSKKGKEESTDESDNAISIKNADIHGSVFGERFGMLRVGSFSGISPKLFRTIIRTEIGRIFATAKEPIKGITIDLRNNTGGRVLSALYLISEFMDAPNSKILTYVRQGKTDKMTDSGSDDDADPEIDLTRARHGDPRLKQIPLLILVDSSTASASEIVAGTLQFYGFASVASADEKTFGKGLVVVSDTLSSSGSKIELATHEYFIGGIKRVQGYGISPDIRVKRDDDEQASGRASEIPPSGPRYNMTSMKVRYPARFTVAKLMLIQLGREIENTP
jgi:hypothetical protein